MNIITVNHTTIAGTEALDVVMADEAIALKKRVEELEKAFETCHTWHNIPHICVDMVDKYYHELFSDAYNPHKHWSERK